MPETKKLPKRYPVLSYRELLKLFLSFFIDDTVLISFGPQNQRVSNCIQIRNMKMTVKDVYLAAGVVVVVGRVDKFLQEVRIPTERLAVFPTQGKVCYWTGEWGYVSFTIRSFADDGTD